MHYPESFSELVEYLKLLPGVGRRGAERIALAMIEWDGGQLRSFGELLAGLPERIGKCPRCGALADGGELCRICSDPRRDVSQICVVENIQDVMAVENTMQYRGVYHVLGGVISPMDGVSPSDLHIESLIERVAAGEVKEVILALSSTMEGDTTNFYIYRKLAQHDIKLSVIARGISVGDELEYADEVTLGRSIINRTPFTGKTI